MSILIVFFVLEASEPHGWLGMNKYKRLTKNPMKRCTTATAV
jgi:hypothetical protein